MGKLQPKKKLEGRKGKTEGMVSREKLLGALRLVRSGIPSVAMLEQTDHFLFYPDRVVSCGGRMIVVAPLVTGLDKYSVPADKLYKVIDKLAAKELKIGLKKKQLVFEGKSEALGLSYIHGGQVFEAFESLELDELKWKKLPDHFLTAVKFCRFCVSKDTSRPELMCVYFNGVDVFSSDKYRVSWYKGEQECSEILLQNIIFPALLLCSPTKYCQAKGTVFFKNDEGVILGCAEMTGEFVDAQSIFPKKKGQELKLPLEKLHNMLQKVVVLLDDEFLLDREVEIRVSTGKMTCYAQRGDVGWFKEKAEMKGELEICFTVNPDFLVQAIDHSAKFYFIDEGRIELTADKGRFRHVISLS